MWEPETTSQVLKNSTDIIIKPADKGGQIVLQDCSDYLFEANRQLSYLNYYQPLQQSLQPETQNIIRTIIKKKLYDQNYINRTQLTNLFGPNDPSPRLFYLLPKIHKAPQSWTVPYKIPLGRPIVSDCGSDSYWIAKYIDHFINPLAKLHPSYIKDTYDFVEKTKIFGGPRGYFSFHDRWRRPLY